MGSASFLVETYKAASQSCFQQLKFRIDLDCNTFFQHNGINIIRYFAFYSINDKNPLYSTNTVNY